ncbi:hypothetical protein LJ754_01490 [Arthrobacter sp. zg-Y40]|uniref:hypothetical protein n=1 Tax=unclassified Arthrobacter TaxID=235627 RepID=UPI001D139E01|nr:MULTISPECIES: hypothetical protein [unclassified Arthrobacter]MCC3277836.1 hypothetical protein [Arthrobacter sp. zg-Y40]MDK1327068.1 hypothetical protein [Arthrobacter sp. zg-Y1143]
MVSDKQARIVNALRRQILAAQHKVTLDNQLGRTTPVKVQLLAYITAADNEDQRRDCHLGFRGPAPER